LAKGDLLLQIGGIEWAELNHVSLVRRILQSREPAQALLIPAERGFPVGLSGTSSRALRGADLDLAQQGSGDGGGMQSVIARVSVREQKGSIGECLP
jgi:hypothetical protein